MTLTITNEGNEMLAVLDGRLDTAASADFSKDMQPLLDNAGKNITLDCEKLAFISSSGLRLFLTLRKASQAKGGEITIKNASAEVKQVFTITGFVSLFKFA